MHAGFMHEIPHEGAGNQKEDKATHPEFSQDEQGNKNAQGETEVEQREFVGIKDRNDKNRSQIIDDGQCR